MSERCERTSERKSEWPSAYVLILGCSEPLCSVHQVRAKKTKYLLYANLETTWNWTPPLSRMDCLEADPKMVLSFLSMAD